MHIEISIHLIQFSIFVSHLMITNKLANLLIYNDYIDYNDYIALVLLAVGDIIKAEL